MDRYDLLFKLIIIGDSGCVLLALVSGAPGRKFVGEGEGASQLQGCVDRVRTVVQDGQVQSSAPLFGG